MDKAIEQLVEAVKTASPMLWAAAQNKVQADLLAWVCVLVLAMIALPLCAYALVWASKRPGYSDSAFGAQLIGGLIGVLAALAAPGALVEIVTLYVARDWYAIKALVELSPLK
jgi:uncharacterized protein YqgC (DUF456 family)